MLQIKLWEKTTLKSFKVAMNVLYGIDPSFYHTSLLLGHLVWVALRLKFASKSKILNIFIHGVVSADKIEI